jgi:transposase-like protein
MEKRNSSAYNRDVSRRKALRKRRIAKEIYHNWSNSFGDEWEYYNNLHQYSKNKIHCSCPLCSAKTRNKGRRAKHANWGRSINYRRPDLLRQMSMDQQMREEGFNAPRRHAKEWI